MNRKEEKIGGYSQGLKILEQSDICFIINYVYYLPGVKYKIDNFSRLLKIMQNNQEKIPNVKSTKLTSRILHQEKNLFS